MNTCCKKKAKNLFIRFKQDFQDFLNRYVKNTGVIGSSTTLMDILPSLCVLQLLTNGENNSREFVDPPGKFSIELTYS